MNVESEKRSTSKSPELSSDMERALLDDGKRGKCCGVELTNIQILGITGFLFASFVSAEIVGALVSFCCVVVSYENWTKKNYCEIFLLT